MNLPCLAEDGYDLWLRYRPLPEPGLRALERTTSSLVAPPNGSATIEVALAELSRGIEAMTGRAPVRSALVREGAIVLVHDSDPGLGGEGYALHGTLIDGCRVTRIAARRDIGLLYGAFALLRHLTTGGTLENLDQRSAPKLRLRMLNHWDNLDRSVERGYAGQSIWDWWKLPALLDARYADYGRACASLGINAVSLNNVNSKAEVLSAPWIAKAAVLADVLRPYGLRVFLSVRFSSPIELDKLPTADPLDPAVQAWWQAKAAEIYRSIPDFGGFLVKANSEGQPGPHDYGRTHAEGANVFAQALAPHRGIVFWRAFVYSHENPQDRHKQAWSDFKPLDGRFDANVIVQVKNGAIDFQPREPFHPLFGAMPSTSTAIELMVTKEYMGFSTHLAWLGRQYEECLQSDVDGQGTTVSQVLQRPPVPEGLTAMAGVANVGSDRNWCGSHFDQANWYAFGRLAWDPDLSSDTIATEWVRQTFTHDDDAVRRIVDLMNLSREAVVHYMTPLGLHHLMATGHHHGPAPWVADLKRPEWNPVYYHRADAQGIGFDRSPSGSNAVAQYAPALAQRWADPATTPETLLLWFHHLPWSHRMRSGRNLWQELVATYDQGVSEAAELRARWQALQPHIDARRHAEVSDYLAQQEREAQWWRDACLAYFHSVSGQPWPEGAPRPAKTLAEYQAIEFLHAPGRG